MSDPMRDALLEIATLIIDVVAIRGSLGFPSGELYAHLMGYMNLETYQKLMDAIVASGKIRQEGFLYFKDN